MAADAAQTGVSVGSGALAGSTLGPWGAAAGAGLGLISSLLANNGGQNQSAEIANANLAQEQNNQRYAQGLNAEAMRRAIAGSSDSFGSTTQYDPYTNTWVAKLGELPQAAQTAAYGASTLRDTTDVPRATYANAEAALRGSENNRFTSGALNTLNNYTPVSSEGMRGALQDDTTRANNAVYRPLMEGTLRTAARTGTAAGPMLSDLGKASADSLARQMAQNRVQAETSSAGINSARLGSLADTYKSDVAASQPQQSFAPGGTENPMNTITSLLAQRANGAAQPASMGAYSSALGSNAGTAASTLAAGKVPNSNFGSQQLGVAGQSIGNLFSALTNKNSNGQSPWGDIQSWFGGSTNSSVPSNLNGVNYTPSWGQLEQG